MSSSILIPPRNPPPPLPPSTPASTSSSLSSSTPPLASLSASSSSSSSPAKSDWRPAHTRRASLLSSSLAAQEHTVVNVGRPDGPPRLITCVKTSQGFDWNQEIFLPSHAGYHNESDFPDLERRKDPVHEIVLTDEEREKMVPQ